MNRNSEIERALAAYQVAVIAADRFDSEGSHRKAKAFRGTCV
jgi:hypothetical protein